MNKYKLSTFGADRSEYWVMEYRHGRAILGEPPIVHRVIKFKEQKERDLYLVSRNYI